MQKQIKLATFEEAVLPHLDAAYNLAHWLACNDTDAEDLVLSKLSQITCSRRF